MRVNEINGLLRAMVNKLIQMGWVKTMIGRIILGTNGQAHMNHWFKEDDGKANDFGIKPLDRIASLNDHSAQIVFVHDNDVEFMEILEKRNVQFASDLEQLILNYLNKNIETPKIARGGKSKIDCLLDEITLSEPKQPVE